DDGLMVFEVPKEPPSSLANQLKKAIHRDAGLTMKVEVRFAAGVDEIEEGSNEVEAPPPGAAESRSRTSEFAARLKSLAPNYAKPVQHDDAPAVELKALFSQAKTLYEKKDFDGANDALDTLEPLVAKTLAMPEKASAPSLPDRSATYKNRLKALM